MSTEVTTVAGVVVAHRFWGGSQRGTCVQMEVTEREFAAFADEMVSEECSERVERFADWVARQAAHVMWDSAARQNGMAREMEESRFAPMMARAAENARRRARVVAREQMRSV